MKRSVFAAVTVLMALILGACGVKSPPMPPEGGHPNTISKLTARAREDGILLRWEAPGYSEGKKFTKPTRFEIQRRTKTAEKAAWSEYELVGEIPFRKSDTTFEWKDIKVTPGVRYQYRVAAVDRKGRPGPYSYPVAAKWDTPPGKPLNPTAEAGNRTVILRWEPPDTTGAPKVEGYYVYRAGKNSRFELATPYAIPGTEYFDGGLDNGTEYRYHVRAASVSGDQMIEGPPSETVRAIPGDKTAPAAPVGVGAFLMEDGVKIMWWPNEEDDLSGYFVYRKRDEQTERLTPEPLKAPGYLDKTVEKNRLYAYTVTAVDDSGNESPHSEASEIYVK